MGAHTQLVPFKQHLVTGHLRYFAADPLRFLETVSAEQGDFVPLRFLHRRVILINDPAAIEQVLSTQAKHFRKSLGYRSPIMRLLFGQGLLTSEGAFWMRQRKLAQPAFHKERLSSYSNHIIIFAKEMTAKWKDGAELDVHAEVLKLTTRVVTKSLFGVESAQEVEAVGTGSKIVMERFTSQFNAWNLFLSFFPSKEKRDFEAVMQRLDTFVYQVIEDRRLHEQNDLVSMLLRARDEDGNGMSPAQLRDELVTLMVAGLDTTALALSWALYLLARNPDQQDELRASLKDIEPSIENFSRLPFAEAVIKESMRLFPPAWIVGREALADVTIAGHLVRKGDSLIMSQWLKHHDKRYFPDAEPSAPTAG